MFDFPLTAIIIIGAILVVIKITKSFINGDFAGEPRLPIQPKRLMTEHELVFYGKLVSAVRSYGAYSVFSQVAMAAVLTHEHGLEGADRMRVRGKFSQKIIDFVIVDAKANVVGIVELDDRTHVAAKDYERDKITAAAGYTTLRMRNGYRTRTDEIVDQLKPMLTVGRR